MISFLITLLAYIVITTIAGAIVYAAFVKFKIDPAKKKWSNYLSLAVGIIVAFFTATPAVDFISKLIA